MPTLGEEQVCRHRGQPAQSKWLTGATKCNQVHISSTMIQRCNTGTARYMENTGTARYGEYRYSQIWRIQVQSKMENTGTVGDSHSPPRFPCLLPPIVGHSCPNINLSRPALRVQYGDNYYPPPVIGPTPSLNLSSFHLPYLPPILGTTFSRLLLPVIYFSSSPPPLVSYSSCSSTLVRGFRVGPTPVIRKIVREEKEGI